MTTPTLTSGTLADLRANVQGDVLTPADPGYDAARRGWNLAHVSSPAVVVVASCTDDVVEAVRFAAAGGMRVAVLGTGHGPGPAADGALLVVTRAMTRVHVDPVARTVRAEAGAKWADVLGPAQQHGLAPLLGSTSDVGVVGYTLGGGMGWLARRYGLASDSVRSVELVTPDGTEAVAAHDVNSELFWALRGAGAGTLGVVTAVELDLYPVDTVYAGNLFYPAELAAEVFRRFAVWTRDLDEEMTAAVTLMNFPPLPQVPEPMRGRSFVMVRGAYCGADLGRGQELLDRWRSWRAPEIDLFGPMPFAQADLISMDPVDPLPSLVTGECLDRVDDDAVEAVVRLVLPEPGQPPVLLFAELRHAGGAVRRQARSAVNRRGRSGEYLLNLVGVPTGPDTTALEAHLARVRAELAPYVTGAVHLNFLDGDDRRTRARAAFTEDDLERLRSVKRMLDPENRFGFGFGIA